MKWARTVGLENNLPGKHLAGKIRNIVFDTLQLENPVTPEKN